MARVNGYEIQDGLNTGKFRVTVSGENLFQEFEKLNSPLCIGEFCYNSANNTYIANGVPATEEEIKKELWHAFKSLCLTYLIKADKRAKGESEYLSVEVGE